MMSPFKRRLYQLAKKLAGRGLETPAFILSLPGDEEGDFDWEDPQALVGQNTRLAEVIPLRKAA